MILLAALLVAAAFYAVCWYDAGVRLSPDGQYYALMGAGGRVPRPYVWRWLWPLVCGKNPRAWQVASGASLVLCGPALAGYLLSHGFAGWQALAGVVLFCGLPGWFRLNVNLPILVDAQGMLFALMSAWATLEGQHVVAVVMALVAGATRESAPIWAALFGWSFVPLVGLLACGWLRAASSKDGHPEWLQHPLAEAAKVHRGKWLDWKETLLPWGAVAPLAALGALASVYVLPALAATAAGYSQMLIAQDRARLFCWAAPLLIVVGLPALSAQWAVPVLLAHVFNPYRGA